MSSATTERWLALMAVIAAAVVPRGAPCVPVPSSASTTTSASPSDSARARSSAMTTGRRPARRRAASFPAASPVISSGRAASHTATRAPRCLRWRATTKPSPPLPPLPHTTTTRAPRPPRGRSRMMCGTAPRPAFSMRAAPGIPSVSMARRSSRRISSALRTGSTSVRQGGGLGGKVGEERRVDLAPLDAGRLRQFDVQCLGGQTKNADALGAARPIHHGVGRLDEHVEPWTAGAGAKMRAADEPEQRRGTKRVGAVGAHGRNDALRLKTLLELIRDAHLDRKSTRLNSSHGYISYAVFCLKKKKQVTTH